MHRRLDGYTLAVVDLLTSLVVVFAAMAVLAIISARQAAKAGVRPGGLVIQMRWEKSSNSDVDLWVKAPEDHPVGYSHPSDDHCNLLRDDLGRALDPQSRNEEMVVCRGVAAGEWIVDTMLYHSYDRVLPIRVHVTVLQLGSAETQILDRTVRLAHEGQQITVFRFRLDRRGKYVPGSENELPMPLYARQ